MAVPVTASPPAGGSCRCVTGEPALTGWIDRTHRPAVLWARPPGRVGALWWGGRGRSIFFFSLLGSYCEPCGTRVGPGLGGGLAPGPRGVCADAIRPGWVVAGPGVGRARLAAFGVLIWSGWPASRGCRARWRVRS